MKFTYAALLVCLITSCGSSSNSLRVADDTAKQVQKSNTDSSTNTDTPEPTPALTSPAVDTTQAVEKKASAAAKTPGIPQDGTYRYDMAFAEFKGESRGEKVTVIINGDSVKVVYEGDGNLKTPRGTVLDEGLIIKHKSGRYIISKNSADAEADVVGGCSGGPNVIDFQTKKYHTC